MSEQSPDNNTRHIEELLHAQEAMRRDIDQLKTQIAQLTAQLAGSPGSAQESDNHPLSAHTQTAPVPATSERDNEADALTEKLAIDETTELLSIDSDPLVMDSVALDPAKSTENSDTALELPSNAAVDFANPALAATLSPTLPKTTSPSHPDSPIQRHEPPETDETQLDFDNEATPESGSSTATKKPFNPISWLLRENPVLKIGAIILFLGVGFLLRYASQYVVVPISVRYGLVFLAGSALTAFAYGYLRPRKKDYSLVVQGTGIAITYLTILAAYRLHHLFSGGSAFILMLMPLAVMVVLSLRQNAISLAQVSLLGGLATPILASSGSGDYISLFGYLSLLNTGFAAIAWFKRWRSLNFISFYGSLGLALLWATQGGALANKLLLSSFILYHLLLYSLVAWRFAHLADEQTVTPIRDDASLAELVNQLVRYLSNSGAVDNTLTISTAFWAFVLLHLTWPSYLTHSGALIALFIGGYYWLCAVSVKSLSPALQILQRVFAYIGSLFATLAIPLYCSQEATLSLWTLQGTMLYGFGWRERNPYWRVIGIVLGLLSVLHFLPQITLGTTSVLVIPFMAWFVLLAAVATVLLLHTRHPKATIALWEKRMALISFAVGLCLLALLPFMFAQWSFAIAGLMLLAIAAAFTTSRLKHDYADITALAILISWVVSTLWWAQQWSLGYEMARNQLWYALPIAVSWIVSARSLSTQPLPSKLLRACRPSAILTLLSLAFSHIWVLSLLYFAQNSVHILPISLPLLAALSTLWFVAMSISGWRHGRVTTFMYLPFLLIIMSATVTFLLQHLGNNLITKISKAVQPLPIDITNSNLSDSIAAVLFAHDLPISHTWWLIAIGILTVIQLLLLPATHYTFKPTLRWLGFNLLALSGLWLFGQLIYPAIGSWHDLKLWCYALPILIILIYAATPWRKNWLSQPTSGAETGSLWTILLAIFFLVFLSAPDPSGIFLPILNAVGLLAVAIIGIIVWYYRQGIFSWIKHPAALWILSIMLWLVGNIELLRMWAIYETLPWDFSTLWESTAVQTTFALVWSMQGIVMMIWANKQVRRKLWIIGATLLGIVVLKLFFVDLSQTNSIARIVSFISVGLLLMAVGYFAPIPPEEERLSTQG